MFFQFDFLPQSLMSNLAGVKHIVVVLSGKGGVGKSTVACQLALALAGVHRARVGILDVDICGPSVPKIVGAEDRPVTSGPSGRWLPVALDLAGSDPDSDAAGTAAAAPPPLKVMSIAYLLPSATDAVVWRGPRKDAMIKQFIEDVEWGDLDYLIVDTPPGTSDEHMTLCEALAQYQPAGAIVVTTPQSVSTDDVRKELSFCAKLKLRVLGIVENMSGFVCPHCSECTAIFSKGGGRQLAAQYECPFLGEVPIDPAIAIAEDSGVSYVAGLLAAGKDNAEVRKQGIWGVIGATLVQLERVEALRAAAAA